MTRVSDVFAYSCPEVSCDPALVTFLLIPAPRSVVTVFRVERSVIEKQEICIIRKKVVKEKKEEES